MNSMLIALAFVGQVVAAQHTEPVQFDRGDVGVDVVVSIDGAEEKTFAGKLAFHDQTHSWTSVCADVRSPIANSQTFAIVVKNSAMVGGNVARAGNIVAKYFKAAQTPQQCAGLQLAVWKALEDGNDGTDFDHGRFQAKADFGTMLYAQQYVQAEDEAGNALYLQTQGSSGGTSGGSSSGGSGGQSQMSTGG